jgi:hypothetical protein
VLDWRWVGGDATDPEDLGDPFTETDYALCLYDASTGAQPLVAALAPAGGQCGALLCWHWLGGTGPAIEFYDHAAERGGSTNPDGVRRIRLRPGGAGKARVSAQGRGEKLRLPTLPLTAPVTMQIQASNGTCWSAGFDRLVTRNEIGSFRAQSGSPSAAFVDVVASRACGRRARRWCR